MLELTTGEPRWYDLAVGGIILLLIVGLVVNRVQIEYSLLLLAFAGLTISLDYRARQVRASFPVLLVASDFSLTLLDLEGNQYPVERSGGAWVTSKLVVLPFKDGLWLRRHIIISAEHNCVDAFRRFSVICRYRFAVTETERHNVAQLNPQGIIK